MTKVEERIQGVSFGNYHLADLEYADDTIVLATTVDQLRDALVIYQEEANKLGLRVSWPKTKAMHIGDGPNPPPICIGDDTVEFVKSFVYLGALITNNGDLKPETPLATQIHLQKDKTEDLQHLNPIHTALRGRNVAPK